MTKTYHQRVVVLNYDSNIPKFKTNEEQRAWYEALGRMVAYGMHNTPEQDSVQLVTGAVEECEITLCYYEKHRRDPDQPWEVSHEFYKAVDKMREQSKLQPFVMGAVRRSDTEWSYHS